MLFNILLPLYLLYTIACFFLSKKIHKDYFYYFNPLFNEAGEDIHEKYPEFKKYDSKFFTWRRLFIGFVFTMPIKMFITIFCIVLFWIFTR